MVVENLEQVQPSHERARHECILLRGLAFAKPPPILYYLEIVNSGCK